jgi:hypothetical protein
MDDVLEAVLEFASTVTSKLKCSAADVAKILRTLTENGKTLRRGGFKGSWFPYSIRALEQILEEMDPGDE